VENLNIHPAIQDGGEVGVELMWIDRPLEPAVWISLEELINLRGHLPDWVVEQLGIEIDERTTLAVYLAIDAAEDLLLELESSTH
jgi:hypothetical protein